MRLHKVFYRIASNGQYIHRNIRCQSLKCDLSHGIYISGQYGIIFRDKIYSKSPTRSSRQNHNWFIKTFKKLIFF